MDLTGLDFGTLYELYKESETLRETGVLPEDAQLRAIAKQYFANDTVLILTTISSEVYRLIAQRYISFLR